MMSTAPELRKGEANKFGSAMGDLWSLGGVFINAAIGE